MALALSLHAAGLDDVDVYESAPSIKELGVGIQVLPHATRELTELGLLEVLSAVSIPMTDYTLYSKLGQLVWREPRGLAAGYRWPQVAIHRGRLLGVLYRAVVDRLGEHRVHVGHHVADFGQDQDGRVWASFGNRATDTFLGRVEADLLVGCDGIHSVVRRALYPDEGPPLWNGVTMWRGVIAYPIEPIEADPSRALINWVAMFKTADGGPLPPQDWTHAARREDALAPFAAYVFDFLDLPALIRATEVVYQYPMVDRDPLPTWDFGQVTLLGDAAHPMHPFGANGASQAILDARVLARELALQPSIKAAVAAYDAERRPITGAVVRANRQAGPSRCQEIIEERAPNGFANLADVVSQAELAEIASAYKRTAGFDPSVLNNRPSLSVRPE
jgi:2-polyprenyl-6-methoxyphenol hydroxylase-like FAD-dependent oxidoreductase